MSYCRFSSDNWKSDVYCYEDWQGGWTTHVASNRVVGEVPKVDFDDPKWLDAEIAQMDFLNHAERTNIELPYAGEQYNDPTLESFKDRLLILKRAGFHIPEHVFEEIDEEITSGEPTAR